MANHVLPLPIVSVGNIPCNVGHGSPPLGWFKDVRVEMEDVNMGNGGSAYFCSDGLNDFAEANDLNPLSLAWHLANINDSDEAEKVIADRDDDILVVQVKWIKRENPPSDPLDPFFFQSYPGNTVEAIDHYQTVWEKSIQLCLQHISEKTLWNISLCIREALINALNHGCKKQEDLNAMLTLSLNPELNVIIMRITDDGAGYETAPTPLNPEVITQSKKEHISFGLSIIRSYSVSCDISNNGSTMVAQFKF